MKNKRIVAIVSVVLAIVAAIFVIGVGVSMSETEVKEDTTVESSGLIISGTQNTNDESVESDEKEPSDVSQSEITVNNNNLPEEKTQVNNVDGTDESDVVVEEIKGLNKSHKAKLNKIPEFSDKPYCVINGNMPGLKANDASVKYFEKYTALDNLGRCGVAYACLGKETMPTEERGEIGQVKPSGWKTVKYDCVDGKYLYNRCHLIGFQLSGENANNRNLITGTRYMNVQGMLPFENMVADYIKETGNHVLYRVTPVFKDYELVARGVQIEAYSVEDDGEGICFNVYCYNNQPGVKIDYATGNSELNAGVSSNKTTTEKRPEKTTAAGASNGGGSSSKEATYILNTNSQKIHRPTCSSVKKMKESNKQEYTGSKNDLIAQGYTSCGICNP